MSLQLWIGFGFTVSLVVFLIITFFVKDTSSPAQYNTLRFLTALCGGFAGGFLAGEALFSLQKEYLSGAKLGVSGTAGFAIFFAVWFTYPKRHREQLEDNLRLSIPEGWTFEQAALAIGKATRRELNLRGIKPEHRSTKLHAIEINASDAGKALEQLRYSSNALPDYRVELDGGVYHLRDS
ncbi:hypothetical protein [Halomonas sp. TD01]|uniref:hypothetical protein n=1 Tax=Halomonas sp. TD01 TaxID=999141 RepID=UPI000214F232|nr:hypothetical protein [Halomonas sp. TD01]EGP19467.1 hypothetical protein GME_11222 [Halomonas sp. TD01]CAH1044901.1 hypothetical protein HPTD01_3379 [Halomonas sp. TD01]